MGHYTAISCKAVDFRLTRPRTLRNGLQAGSGWQPGKWAAACCPIRKVQLIGWNIGIKLENRPFGLFLCTQFNSRNYHFEMFLPEASFRSWSTGSPRFQYPPRIALP